MSIRVQCVWVDTTDPDRIARFWADVLGWRRTHQSADEIMLEPPEGSAGDGVTPGLRVPELGVS